MYLGDQPLSIFRNLIIIKDAGTFLAGNEGSIELHQRLRADLFHNNCLISLSRCFLNSSKSLSILSHVIVWPPGNFVTSLICSMYNVVNHSFCWYFVW